MTDEMNLIKEFSDLRDFCLESRAVIGDHVHENNLAEQEEERAQELAEEEDEKAKQNDMRIHTQKSVRNMLEK